MKAAANEPPVDTNVLLRIAQASSPDRQIAEQAVIALDQAKITLNLVPQVIYEFWVSATRPVGSNGLGMPVPLVEQSIEELLRDFVLLRDERGIFARWQSLVISFQVQGKSAHDTRLVAAMQRHGVTNLLTFNHRDFARFPGIAVFTPAEIIAGRLPV